MKARRWLGGALAVVGLALMTQDGPAFLLGAILLVVGAMTAL